ncbi:MAG TPA: branched-chain amino acid dehydrogenase [Firmicutes bacterium]|nr:branched-chain amino acid dehydrogenase [Bacillota bacterium]HBK60775.1 branched-chain amino acid dehydrogenase [Bacillota bacterium]
MTKLKTINDALAGLTDGMTIMVGGFLGTGCPEALVDEIIRRGVRNLTLIANDTAMPDRGYGRLFAAGQIKRVVCSYMGLNPTAIAQKLEGAIDVELAPQGTLAERIRAGGSGLGGVLTPTGVGTIVEEGKMKIEMGGRVYLVELPLRADVALINASLADHTGNLVYRKSARNFNPLMAMAADYVVAQASRVQPIGEIDPDHVMTPGVVVDAVVEVS